MKEGQWDYQQIRTHSGNNANSIRTPENCLVMIEPGQDL